MNLDKLKDAVWKQFGAAIDMMENAIRHCPDDLWADDSHKHPLWYMTYHTLFFLDFYLSETEEGFHPPKPFTLSELDPRGILPERTYTKDELLQYLEHSRQKCRKRIASLTEETAFSRCGFERRNFSNLEMLLYNMRHVQHHCAQFNAILRQRIDSAPDWVPFTKAALDA